LPRPRRQIDEYARRARALANELAEGRLAPADWRDATAAVVRDAHATAAVAAAGPDGVDSGALSDVVAGQLGYLDDFAADVASGKQPLDGRLLARAEMYASAANATYEETRRGVKAAGGARWERRVLGSDSDHCQDCLNAASLGWQPLGTLPAISESKCLTRCTCRFQYSSSREKPSDASFSDYDESLHPRERRGRFATKEERQAVRAARDTAYRERAEKVRAKLGKERIEAVKAAVADLLPRYAHLYRFGHPAVPENDLVAEMMRRGLAGGTGVKAFKILDALVFVGELASHETGGGPFNPRQKLYSFPLSADFADSDFEAKHPRARGGRFGTKSGAAAKSAPPEPPRITDQTSEHVKQRRYLGARVRGMADDGVPPARLAAYHATAQAVIDALPAPAATRLYNRLFGGVFYKSVQTLNAEFQKRGGVVPGGQCAGFAQMNRGEVHLDQPTASGNERRGVYAHELGHIIDRGIGGQPPISSTPEWDAAWKEEIVGRGAISDYARTSALEGFAEYWRMVDIHIQDMVKFHDLSQEQAAAKVADKMSSWLPQCTAVLRAHGAL
jgi:hypothetical protein